MIGKTVKITSISRGQLYNLNRPVELGAIGIIKSKSSGATWNVELIDPKDNKPCLIWFHDFDFKDLLKLEKNEKLNI